MDKKKFYNKAKKYKLNNKYELAIENYKKGLELDKYNFNSLKELGELYEIINDYNGAISCYKKIVESTSQNVDTNNKIIYLNRIGVCYEKTLNYEEALKYFKKVLEFTKDNLIYSNIAKTYFNLRQYRHSEINWLISLKLSNYDESAYKDLGLLNCCMKRYNKSIDFYMKIKNIFENDENLFNIGFHLSFPYLSSKNFKIGFELYEHRLKKNRIAPLTGLSDRIEVPTVPYWNGIDKCDNLLLIYEQGIGDNFQYYRFVIQLARLHPEMKITYFCKDIVAHILKEYENIKIVKSADNLYLYNYKCFIMSLPFFLKIDNIIPNTENYINVDEDRVIYWKNKLDIINPQKKMNVGFFYKGLLNTFIEKNIPLQDFEQLVDLNINLICLHKLKEIEELNSLSFKDKIVSFDIDNDMAFVDTIAILQCIDVLLTVDTSIIHLAGVLGIKTILMLGYTSDWRWFADNEKVWYNSVELLRVKDNVELKTILPEVKMLLNDMM